jgi:hypothetical protein
VPLPNQRARGRVERHQYEGNQTRSTVLAAREVEHGPDLLLHPAVLLTVFALRTTRQCLAAPIARSISCIARSANLIVRRRDEEGLSRFEQRTANKPKHDLTEKAPYRFESGFLHRRVGKLSLPARRRAFCSASEVTPKFIAPTDPATRWKTAHADRPSLPTPIILLMPTTRSLSMSRRQRRSARRDQAAHPGVRQIPAHRRHLLARRLPTE